MGRGKILGGAPFFASSFFMGIVCCSKKFFLSSFLSLFSSLLSFFLSLSVSSFNGPLVLTSVDLLGSSLCSLSYVAQGLLCSISTGHFTASQLALPRFSGVKCSLGLEGVSGHFTRSSVLWRPILFSTVHSTWSEGVFAGLLETMVSPSYG